MFLLTFVLIIISTLGVYTQVYALEAARFMANQTSLASTLVTWHTTAAGVAANAMLATGPGTSCSLTPSDASSTQCPASIKLTSASSNKAITTGTYTNLAGITVSPPASLSSTIYQWKSVAFAPAAGGGYYTLTYVPPSAVSTGLISTASSPSAQLNVTMSDLYRQLRLLGIPIYSFGYVSNGTLNVAPIMINGVLTPVSYPLPAGVTIPSGSLGIISSPGQCSSC